MSFFWKIWRKNLLRNKNLEKKSVMLTQLRKIKCYTNKTLENNTVTLTEVWKKLLLHCQIYFCNRFFFQSFVHVTIFSHSFVDVTEIFSIILCDVTRCFSIVWVLKWIYLMTKYQSESFKGTYQKQNASFKTYAI